MKEKPTWETHITALILAQVERMMESRLEALEDELDEYVAQQMGVHLDCWHREQREGAADRAREGGDR